MVVKATLLPGSDGAKALLKQCGEPLACVRYRYDKTRNERYKTVEPIVDGNDGWQGTICSLGSRAAHRFSTRSETHGRKRTKDS